jgi:Mrp family chromosome partitioning ATPase
LAEKLVALARDEAEKSGAQFRFAGFLEQPSRPISPVAWQVASLATGIGLLLALILPFTLELADRRVTSAAQAEAILQAPSMGSVAVDRPPLTDSVRFAKPLHEFVAREKKVLLLSSPAAMENRVLGAFHVAQAFADSGLSTLLVEGDPQDPQVHRVIGYRPNPGWSDVFEKRISLSDACRSTSNTNLSVLTIGTSPIKETDFFSSKRFRSAVSELRSRFDHLIIPTPPILNESNRARFRDCVDGIVLLVPPDETRIANLRAVQTALQREHVPLVGFLFIPHPHSAPGRQSA